jgi:hypothetical protein
VPAVSLTAGHLINQIGVNLFQEAVTIRSSLPKLPGGWQKAANATISRKEAAGAARSRQEAARTVRSWQEEAAKAAKSWQEAAISHIGQEPPGAAFDQPASSLKKSATTLEIKTITLTTPIITTTAASLRTETQQQGETETQ